MNWFIINLLTLRTIFSSFIDLMGENIFKNRRNLSLQGNELCHLSDVTIDCFTIRNRIWFTGFGVKCRIIDHLPSNGTKATKQPGKSSKINKILWLLLNICTISIYSINTLIMLPFLLSNWMITFGFLVLKNCEKFGFKVKMCLNLSF